MNDNYERMLRLYESEMNVYANPKMISYSALIVMWAHERMYNKERETRER